MEQLWGFMGIAFYSNLESFDTVDMCQGTAIVIVKTVMWQSCLPLLNCIMIYNHTIQCHPEEDGSLFETGFSQGRFLNIMSGIFPWTLLPFKKSRHEFDSACLYKNQPDIVPQPTTHKNIY